MSAYYETSQWPPSGQAGWDHQTPPPARSGASSTVPREEPAAFTHQLDEVDRAIDNLIKSGKMFGGAGARRESPSYRGPARTSPAFDGRPPAGPGSRPNSVANFDDARGPHTSSNLQNFYATQRHQSSRGSNEAEQMMQAKRRMAAQRERELRNYHQEQQYNRTVLSEMSYGSNKSDRAMSPGSSLSEDDRRKFISRSALYGGGGEGPFGPEGTGPAYPDETVPGGPRFPGPAALRGHSPLTYEYGRAAPPVHPDATAAGSSPAAESAPGGTEQLRSNSNASPQSNPGGKGYDAPSAAAQQASRTSASSPGGSPPRQGAPIGKGPQQGSVAPIGTRPSAAGVGGGAPGALTKRSTTPLPSPLSQGYNAAASAGGSEEGGAPASAPTAGPASAGADGGASVGLAGWGARPNGWGSKPGLGVQASVWG
ncbi:hypothetical protein C8A05DRAFT_19381 [Staphylotrichum tortipilum]|uniref:Uncharacterized protein n=1 Tax=Staphylotrichum tortipilum TaxID=2831512 RepID=A0AAN6MDJ1_9PEZI|nr:hypothetical protein C8A05DRAFT_19381 [Staphylotrichum longicolle]